MTEFEYGDIVRCVKADATQTGPLKEGALYVVEGVATHGKSILIAQDWHKVRRFVKVGESNLPEPETDDQRLKARMNCHNLELLRCCRDDLSKAFVWDASDEGFDYWHEVVCRIDKYRRRFRDDH